MVLSTVYTRFSLPHGGKDRKRQPHGRKRSLFMPRDASTSLPQPVFNEGNVTPDPSRFHTTHPTDGPQYKQLGNLLKKDVVSFDRSRAKTSELFTLQSALGPHGPEIIQKIKNAGK